MPNQETTQPVGVIVARFHVPDLHEGHRYLIDCVITQHSDILIILGVPPKFSDRNPLSFEMRKGMIEQTYPGQSFTILPLDSSPSSDERRSKAVDDIIRERFPGRSAVIYGSRESFIHNYRGTFKIVEVPTVYSGSATEIRKNTGVINSSDFRSGVIYSAVNRPPHAYPTVDVAVIKSLTRQVLLVGKNRDEGKLRFPGVFFDPHLDESYEAAAQRCLTKELPTITSWPPRLVGSIIIDDWQVSRTHDRIVTLFTRSTYTSGEPRPGKGVDFVRWVSVDDVPNLLVECHIPLIEFLHLSMAS